MPPAMSRLLTSLIALPLLVAVVLAQDKPLAPPAGAQDLAEQQEQAAQEPTEEPDSTKKPPLQLLDNAAEVNLGTLMDRERRQFTVKLRHAGDKPLAISLVRSTCPCLEIVNAPQPFTLAPGAEMTIEAILKANTLPVKPFARLILVNVADYDPYFIKVVGDIAKNVSFAPAPVIQLGSFVGLKTSWTRTITLKFDFPEGKQIVLEQPAENKLLTLAVSSPEPNTFVVAATPKLPLPAGKLDEVITLPTRGVDGYGSVQIAFRGTVTGWDLAVVERIITIDTAQIEPGKGAAAELTIVPRSEAPPARRLARRFKGGHSHAQNDDRVAEKHVENDEQAAGELKRKETWQDIAKAITVNIPEGSTMDIVPEDTCIKLRLSFPEQFFAQRNRYSASVMHNKKIIGRLNIVAK
ncbi:MAG TPA: DUF1573 domain-containing protein [Lentisphaeria bacterium]|nr:MAG: hypothetical protein BWX73_00487 [Lentisphaerae bacterium ADurb.Bin082]HPY91386.1 DUF1573 domain-containing protein [Lentisphaeria bacterium]HQL86975.1 DUF1573 domain-containing protein [Lentisphaeria bacterium]